ncbi:ACP S-malonyltransferase [Gallionella capsiferriformans]|jgi:[acyl-carrier-protein] S-malonyltransferase|uniref:Malonyl CoA-acyl carrier protein transacylase n=1 Tax=Gallionella capsiferriformans (strain ES-2) TaxID=395494 RepID=D9SGC3_GALCS|nr:ACP S-malonyltransferase [Gallionella capsiferriformans]ADL55570.1 malonyl CoA-acyl carrier protein transacylase [Gallionella capsiferriformans ES-2]
MTKFAFVFPGQGSQSRGMMNGYADFPVVRDTFAEASDVLQQDLWQLIQEGTDAELNSTVNTQPLMLTAGVAVYRAWQSQNGATPAMMAGHSLGEYTALVAAGALSFADALPLVRYRAECMQHAVPEGVGGIAAILGLDDEAVRAVCLEGAQGEVLEAVNYNSPGQVVIAGNRAAVERGMELAKARGAKRAIMLPMSVPSHCSLLTGAASQLRAYLADVAIVSPVIAVLHNADVAAYSDADKIKDALVRQLYSPVRWVETVLEFGKLGITHNVECAPGRVLAGLNKRIDTSQQALAINDGAALTLALTTLA